MAGNRIITVQNIPITISANELDDYICITDIAAAKSEQARAADVVKNWLRNRNTLEFLGTWEQIYNPNFKVVEFDHFRKEAGLHTFVLSVSEWIQQTDAVKNFIIPAKNYKMNLEWLAYAEEADVLTVLSNLETHNAQMIREGKSKEERFKILEEIAEYQLKILNEADCVKMLGEK